MALACSFGGPSGMVLLDVTMQIDRSVPVYYLDTGLLFDATHDLIARVHERYAIEPIAVRPELSVEAQGERHGQALWASDPDRCCALRKVEPHRAFMRGFDAWMTAIRRAQSQTRENVIPVDRDADGLTKVSPLYDWTDEDVWSVIEAREIPVNALHAAGYPSIGCIPCTRPVADGADPRSGRWAGFMKTECGLHPATTAGR